ncbi:MAG TPA: hypothetical protein VE963_03670 [Reyranella sp.]|nr:hypothetical protein [Reyranella sp.]
MDIYWVQHFWFNNFTESNGNTGRAYLTIDGFGTRNVAVTAQLNVVGPGAHIEINDNTISGDLGSAAVGIIWYEYNDANGSHHVDTNYFQPQAVIHNCTALRIELAYRRVWAGATGTVLYFND